MAEDTPKAMTMESDGEALRRVMRHWATGVAVLTARAGQQAHGMTVNSFTSVSLDPPLVSVCIERGVRTHGLIERAGAFAVSLLHAGQAAISERFAGRDSEHGDRFEGLGIFEAVTGAPILADNLGYVDCVVVGAHEAGTHTVYIARVAAADIGAHAHHNGHVRPLVYFDRGYHTVA